MPKLSTVLILLGGAWLLFLYFNSADVQYFGHESNDEMSLACAPLGSLRLTVHDLDDPLTLDQRAAVSAYVSKVQESDSSRDLEPIRSDAEQSVLADCEQARLDRVALIVLVAFATGLLVVSRLIRSRLDPTPEPDQATTTADPSEPDASVSADDQGQDRVERA
jgi:hypothetical protein